MIKVSNSLAVLALLLACSGSASAAAPASCPGGAMSQLLAATPAGPDALNEISIILPTPSLAPRSGPGGMPPDTARLDGIIKDMAASARESGKPGSARLFTRLLNEGTPEEKLEFLNGAGKTYAIPKRFYWKSGIVKTASVCRRVAELFCWIACTGLGENRQCAAEQCKTVIVESCP